VIKKWQNSNSPGVQSSNSSDNIPWYKQDAEMDNMDDKFVNRRIRRKLKSKTSQSIAAKEILHSQKMFKIQAPNLQSQLQNYEISQCKHCKTILKYIPITAKQEIHSKTLDLLKKNLPDLRKSGCKATVSYDAFKKKTISTSITSTIIKIGMVYIKKAYDSLCYQTKDMSCLQELTKLKLPVLYLSNDDSFISIFILYLSVIQFTNKVPFSLINGEAITSSVARYFLQKMGFILLGKNIDIETKHKIVKDIKQMLQNNGSMIALLPTNYELILSPYANILKDLLKETKTDRLLKNLHIVPISVSSEELLEERITATNQSGQSLFSYFAKLMYPRKHYGLIHVNISRPVSIESLQRIAGEMSPPTEDEELNLIVRHIRHELLLSCTILPVNIVSFLLLYQFPQGVLQQQLCLMFEVFLTKLKDQGRYLGFMGKSDCVVKHAIKILHNENLISIDDTKITPLIKQNDKSLLLRHQSTEIIQSFMSKSVVATSLISCIGGSHKLYQGTGSNISQDKNKLFGSIKYLAELISYVLDFYCPFTDIEVALDELIATMPMVSNEEEYYEDQRHQKLVQSVQMNYDDDDEDDFGAFKQTNATCTISVDDDSIESLMFLNSIVKPYVELYYNVLLLLQEKKPDDFISTPSILSSMKERHDQKHFLHGDVLTMDTISRVFDFLYEKEVIDEYGTENYLLSELYVSDESMFVELINEIANYR